MQSTPQVRAVLFDLFGTLVTSETDHLDLEYPNTALMVHRWGYENAGERFADVWNAVMRTLELTTSRTMEEFSMADVVQEYDDTEQLGLTDDRRFELLDSVMAEWRDSVRPIDGVPEMLATLNHRVLLGIVANTHDKALTRVIDLSLLGAAFDPTLLSVLHGHRKPHPTIYQAALDGLRRRIASETSRSDGSLVEHDQARSHIPNPVGASSPLGSPRSSAGELTPGEVLFVGDSYDLDYAGPLAAGFRVRLLDPHHRFDIPSEHRLDSVLDLIDLIDAP